MYGGKAGSGKSWVLVIDALGLQFVNSPLKKAAYQIPEYRAVLFRRTSKQLTKLLDEARKYYPLFGATYTSQRYGDPGACWEFPSGAKIFLCHMEYENDKENHQGQEYQFVGFDELTHFTITQYLYLFSRLRHSIKGMYPRIRSTTNPTGIGLWWVKKRFITGRTPGIVNWYIADGEPEINPLGKEVPKTNPDGLPRVFIPGHLHENKILLEADPTYAIRIKAMGKQMEKALLLGDWDAFGGDFFSGFNQEEIISGFPIPNEWRLVLSVDPGYSSPCSAGLMAQDFETNVYRISTYYERNRNPEQHADGVNAFIKNCKWTRGRFPDVCVADPSAWARRDRFSVLASDRTFADIFEDAGIPLEKAVNDRIPGWWAMKALIPDQFYIFEFENTPLLEEMTSVIADEKHPEDIAGCGNDPTVKDHALDECRYNIMAMDAPKPKATTNESGWVGMFNKQVKSTGGWYPGGG